MLLRRHTRCGDARGRAAFRAVLVGRVSGSPGLARRDLPLMMPPCPAPSARSANRAQARVGSRAGPRCARAGWDGFTPALWRVHGFR